MLLSVCLLIMKRETEPEEPALALYVSLLVCFFVRECRLSDITGAERVKSEVEHFLHVWSE